MWTWQELCPRSGSTLTRRSFPGEENKHRVDKRRGATGLPPEAPSSRLVYDEANMQPDLTGGGMTQPLLTVHLDGCAMTLTITRPSLPGSC